MLTPDNVQQIFPLSPLQEGMLFHHLMEQGGAPGERAYGNQMVLRLRGRIDPALIERSWALLIARHDALRTVFKATGAERPVQIVLRRWPFRLENHDLRATGLETRRRSVEDIIAELRGRPFDLAREVAFRIALLRTADDEALMVWGFHHILLDGWCIGLLQDQFSELYTALAAGREPSPGTAPSYRQFVDWIESRRAHGSLEFWRHSLAGYAGRSILPGRLAQPGGPRRMAVRQVVLDEALSDALRELAKRAGVTLRVLIEALWGLLVARFNHSHDVVFGAVAALRPPEIADASKIVGPCINTLPRRLRFTAGETVVALLGRLQAEQAAWQDAAHVSLSEIYEDPASQAARFDHVLVFENYPRAATHQAAEPSADTVERLAADLTAEQVDVFEPTTYDLTVLAFPETRLRLSFKVNEAVITAAEAENVAARLVALARRAVAAPEAPVDRLGLLGDDEERVILEGWSQGGPGRGATPTVAAQRRRVVAAAGTAPALRYGGRCRNHAELQRDAEALAHHLSDRYGVAAGRPVILLAPPSDHLITAMLACLLLGAPFVPVESTTPPERVARIAVDCAASLLLSAGVPLPDALPPGTRSADLAESLRDSAAGGAPEGSPALADPAEDADAYIVYTSGTTGGPKGVLVGQRSLLNYVGWLAHAFGLGAADRTLPLTSAAYDLGFTGLFGTLLLGGCLTVLSEAERRDPARIIDLVEEHQLTFFKATPSVLRLLLDAPEHGRLATAPALRLLILGGEEQRFADLRRLQGLAPHLQLVNHYGPTEATIGCIAGPLDRALLDSEEKPPQRIGRPIAGARILLCDPELNLVPPGIAGEILIGGLSLAKGYVNAGDQDRARFVTVPALPGERFYRTGDEARWLPDGTIAFLGRRDDQLKIRGYRVAPREVEAALRALPGVADAVVTADRQADGEAELVAILVAKAESTLSPAALREALAVSLPAAMIPTRFVPVSRLPVTANGKLDRAMLAAALAPRPAPAPKDETGTPLEETLRAIWRAVLFREHVGLDENFFELGGHSIKAIQILSRIRAATGTRMPVRALFDHPTVRRLAHHLAGGVGGTESDRLLPLRQGPAEAPMSFWLPAVVGSATIYKELIDRLSPAATCFGLQCRGFDRAEPLAADIPAMAAEFAAAIRHRHRLPVYTLAGWSFGGFVAMETARRLEADGCTVRLILIDTPPARDAFLPEVESATTTLAELGRIPQWSHVVRLMTRDLAQEELDQQERLLRHNVGLARSYGFPGGLRADIFCLEATANPRPLAMSRLAGLTTGRVRVEFIGGDHYSMFHPPHLARLVEALSRVLPSGADA